MAMNGETLDYKHIYQENRGTMHEGRLQLLNEKIIFKNQKTGKTHTMNHEDVMLAFWRQVAKDYELKLVAQNGAVFRFDGFKESDFSKLKEFLQDRYDVELEEQELSSKGWNWGKADFKGDEMSFQVPPQRVAFEIPLMNVSQCQQSKDEVTLEFHQNDDTDLISLMEMRFYIPPSQEEDVDRVQEFHDSVMAKADVLQVKGNAICTFQDMKFLTPRGHYDVRMYPKFIQLHGKTYDYKITYTSILRLFLLPNKDQRQMFFVISMDPPLKQGQTRYNFLIMLFQKETDLSVELVLDDELKQRYKDKLEIENSGPAYEVVSKIIRHLSSRKITVPGKFYGSNGSQSITCSYKANSGFLFPLERGFMYVIKPPLHIRFDEISFVNFARGASCMTNSFDFEIEHRNKMSYTFSNIEKGQYKALYDFVSGKGLRIKNIGKDGGGGGVQYNDNMQGSDDSGDEGSARDHDDVYMRRIKRERQEQAEAGGMDDDDDESDDDFAPDAQDDDDVKEEFDSDASSSSDEDEDEERKAKRKREKERRRKQQEEEEEGSSSGEEENEETDEEQEREKMRKKMKQQERKQKAAASKPQKSETGGRKQKPKKDPNAPKRPQSAFFLWLNESRQSIKEENPGISITELTKLAGQKWKTVSSETKSKYEKLYQKSKEEYQVKLNDYNNSGSAAAFKAQQGDIKSSKSKKSVAKPSAKKSVAKAQKPESSDRKVKSVEIIEDSGSSSSDDSDSDGAAAKSRAAAPPPVKQRKKEVVKAKDEEEMATESEAESSAITDSDDE